MKAFILITIVFFSCSTIKKVTDKQDKEKTDKELKVDEKSLVKTDTEKKTLTTIEADTTVLVKGSDLEGEKSLKDAGVKPWTLDDMDQVVTITIDSAKGTVQVRAKAKDKVIPVHIKKTIQEDLKETKVEKKDSAATSTEKTSIQTRDRERDVKRFGIPAWIWILLLLIALAYLGWRFRSKIFP